MKIDNMMYTTVDYLVNNIAEDIFMHFTDFRTHWQDIDIAIDCPQDAQGVQIATFYNECVTWIGIKHIESPFDSGDILLMVDMYGGGAAQLIQVYNEEDFDSIASDVQRALKDCVECCGYGLSNDEFVLSERLEGDV